MKKLKLAKIDFQKSDILTRSQLKNILGGSGTGSGAGNIASGRCKYVSYYWTYVSPVSLDKCLADVQANCGSVQSGCCSPSPYLNYCP